MTTKFNAKVSEITGVSNMFDLALHIIDLMNDEATEKIKEIVSEMDAHEQKQLLYHVDHLPYWVGGNSGSETTLKDLAEALQLDNVSRTNKIVLESSTFARAKKKELKEILPHVKSFDEKPVPEFGKVLYIKDEKNRTIAHCYKEKGKLILLVKGV